MLWLKAIHIAAVITWIGGMLLNALIIAILMTERTSSTEGAKGHQPVDLARRLDRTMTAPAMLLAWVLGMTLAIGIVTILLATLVVLPALLSITSKKSIN